MQIDSEKEKQKIVSFLKEIFEKQHIDHAVIGLSGGIDSTTSFFLLKEVLPPQNIHVAHMYYFQSVFAEIEQEVQKAGIPQENIHVLSIKESVDTVFKLLNRHSGEEQSDDSRITNVTEVRDSGRARMTKEENKNDLDKIRLGNIAARMRMIVLFDFAKKYRALVVGTENKSENLLSYFTRFGDQASDIEPIEHLYKTQVYQLAKSLGVPEILLNQTPTAGLWDGQTDEGQFGFSYEEADHVLFLAVEKGISVEEIEQQGFSNARKILEWREKNLFKHEVPYVLEK